MKSISIMTCGSVDDGKSTLLGRLIYETDNLLVDQSEYLSKLNQRYSKKDVDIDYSLLLDGLIDEKEQGITIDIAFKYFTLDSTQFTLIDSPGHKEYTKNMANAATFADAALILVDASKGISEQTKKHIEIVSMFPNIKHRIFCFNKMDKVRYSEEIFKKTSEDLTRFLIENNYSAEEIIPVSATEGDNVFTNSKNMKYYKGPTLYKLLTDLKINQKSRDNGASIVKFINNSTGIRTFYIENTDISYRKGDKLKNVYTNETSEIENIFHNYKSVNSQKNLKNTSVQFKTDISINKGDSLVPHNQNFIISDSFKSKIIWTSNYKLLKSKSYLFKFHSKQIKGFVSKTNRSNISKNDIGEIQIELEEKIHISEIHSNYYFSQLVIVDLDDNSTVGFGYIVQNLDRGTHVKPLQLQKFKKLPIKCIWLTGLPSSGKSTIAEAVGKKLQKLDINYYIIDGDNIRSTLNKDLGFSKEDRIENNRRVANVAKILFDAGVMPIVSTVSPNKSSRQYARSLFNNEEFKLVFINTSIEECIKRDPKQLYSSKNKKINNVTGIGSNYDVPDNYDLKLDTENLSILQCSNRVIKLLF
ncbi:MAG: adenylyl-sulfate kinase [Flavobacteriales bacterium]|nr:adenylyl-sulfate kinase [Flavobacteriales bacterium]